MPGANYTLRLWARGTNRPWGGYGVKPAPASPVTTPVSVSVKLSSASSSRVLGEIKSAEVGFPIMKGQAASVISAKKNWQDDGGNVWLQDGYRMHVASHPLYQLASKDPILDEWEAARNVPSSFLEDQMAIAPIAIPKTGKRALGGTEYETDTDYIYSRLVVNILGGKVPNGLKVESKYTVLANEKSNSEYPWVIDSHYFYDEEEERMWMSWGGHNVWVTEVSTEDLRVCCSDRCATKCSSVEFSEHPEGVHTNILSWDGRDNGFEGDACSMSYMEGPALWKHAPSGNWFAFASWGNMGVDYTIRVCRSTEGPRGPYLDKNGVNCAQYTGGTFGSSMLLGPEGKESVPGHPHLWEEDGTTYMGYDYRKAPPGPTLSNGREGTDFFAVRKIHWITNADGDPGVWPTIWQPLDIAFNSDDFPSVHGETLVLSLANKGGKASQAAVDHVTLSVEMLSTKVPTDSPTKEQTEGPTLQPTIHSTGLRPTGSPTTGSPTTGSPTIASTAHAGGDDKSTDPDGSKLKVSVVIGAAAGGAAILAAAALAAARRSRQRKKQFAALMFDPSAQAVEMGSSHAVPQEKPKT